MDVQLVKSLITRGLSVETDATGISMFPLLLPHCKTIISPIREELKIGDIVSFIRKNDNETKLVLHRIISISDTHITTRGDACLSNDEPHKNTDIVGILTKSTYSFITINHTNLFCHIYGKIILTFSPLSYKFNCFFAHLCLKIYQFFK